MALTDTQNMNVQEKLSPNIYVKMGNYLNARIAERQEKNKNTPKQHLNI